MISQVSGVVLSRGTDWVVVQIGGLGLKVHVPQGRVAALAGESVTLHTSLQVREDSLTLFGFSSELELAMFELLLGVNGVGPRIALAILSLLDPPGVVRAVQLEDHKAFGKVSGVGPKTAKLICVQLAGKLEQFVAAAGDAALPEDGDGSQLVAGNTVAADVVAGLTGLGYREAEAESAVADALGAGAPQEQGALLRAALLLLQKGGR